ncbi:hypothetical protein [Thalassospira xiamenensis]|jgi:hypothetical protein|uniref:hypothetical protein n=1 Tax=Thalassospira xiamenensis TaxID=220697 RepID=UPI000DED3CA6|nr:hypothetical protein [Thalassospira xiamenensis]RCK37304.1 hypothetical protein TH24_17195 [Thalassospira xiamenensis]
MATITHYEVDYTSVDDATNVQRIPAPGGRLQAMAIARRISRKTGFAYVVAYADSQSIGHMPYSDGILDKAGIDGSV